MKKIISALLIVLLLAGAPLVAGAASLTLTNEAHHIIGNLRAVTGTASVTSGDTLAVGLSTILFVGYSVRNSAGTSTMNHTISGTTVTLTGTSGNTWEFFIVGY